MPVTIAFDVYGTLIDTAGVTGDLTGMIGKLAPAFSDHWREKQLEYSFRRGLMQAYQEFSVCTRDALEYTCGKLSVQLTNDQKQELLASYRRLPAFPDALQALKTLRPLGHRLYAFSNGTAADVEQLLNQAGIGEFFFDIISVDEVKRFKPDPAVYHQFLKRAGAEASGSWLVSGNPFDVLGALACGFSSAWIRRNPETQFDPWGPLPTKTLADLSELPRALGACRT